jgi:hypothetical protein
MYYHSFNKAYANIVLAGVFVVNGKLRVLNCLISTVKGKTTVTSWQKW